MAKPTDGIGAYVLKVREDTQRYAQELLSDNDRLRGTVAALESERQRLLEELESHRRERSRLEGALAQTETQSKHFSDQFLQLEAQNSNLANLYVASYRLHSTLDRREVLAAVQEIVANLIGCEELGLYELDADGGHLSLAASFGIDPEEHRRVEIGKGRIGRSAASGSPDVGASREAAPERPEERELSACIPLKVDGRVTGLLALFRLLPQKAGFEPVDHELFELLATHAATALYSCGLQERLLAPQTA